MKKSVIIIISMIVFILLFLNINTILLSLEYPHFFIVKDIKYVDRRINEYLEKPINSDNLEYLWKVLWIKKDKSRHNYISQDQRKTLIKKIAVYEPIDLWEKYLQINILKYKLGVNSVSEILIDTPVCREDRLYVDDVDWKDPFEIGTYFDIIHFCNMNYTTEDKSRYDSIINTENSDIMMHLREHGINNVPVYSNDCKAKNNNEEYHCLYFQ